MITRKFTVLVEVEGLDGFGLVNPMDLSYLSVKLHPALCSEPFAY